MKELLLLLFPLYFACVWLGAMHLAAWLGGWKALAGKYRVTQMPPGQAHWFQSVALTRIPGLPANYGSCTILTITAEGLGLSVLAPFRLGHPPLLIPWTEFYNVQPRTVFFYWKFVDAQIGDPALTTIRLPAWVFEQANQAMGQEI